MQRLNKNQRIIAIGMLELGLRQVDVSEHLGVSLSPVWQDITEFVELLMTFPAQADHELRCQFKTTIFRCHTYIIAFYWQRQLPWLIQVARTTE